MRRLLTVISLLLCTTVSAQFQALIVNEFSQGDQGSREYIELLVVGKRTCTDSVVDLRNWIVDDQSGWFGTGSITAGHYRLRDVPNWSAVPFGSIILLYNSASNGKNLSITLSDDPTDANKDLMYIVPINANAYLEENGTSPATTSGINYVYPAANTTAGYNPTTNTWTSQIGLNNGSDVIAIVSPQDRTTHHFSIGNGFASLPPYKVPTVSLPAVNAGQSAYLTNAQYFGAGSWSIAAVPVMETPGLPNGGGNTAWINAMRIMPVPTRSYTTICSNGPYLFHGQTITASGAHTVLALTATGCVDTNDLYITIKRSDTKDTAACDSLVYRGIKYRANTTITDIIKSVVIDCDSIVRTLNIRIKRSSSSLTRACVQAATSYFFNNQSFTASGAYAVTLANSQGCDSVARLHLVIRRMVNDTVRGCDSIVHRGVVYRASTTVGDTVRSLMIPGCDSLVRATAIIIGRARQTTVSVCRPIGAVYVFNGQTLTASGHYTATFSMAGCDSVVRLNLTIPIQQSQSIEGCTSVNYNAVNYTSTTTIRDTIYNNNGCDSMYKLVSIIVKPLPSSLQNACIKSGEVYSFNGQQLTTTGTYNTTYTRPGLCDSVVYLRLIVSEERRATITGCETVTHNGIAYTTSTTIVDTIRSSSGCDSLYNITSIVVRPKPASYTTACIKEGASYNFNGQTLITGGSYTTLYPAASGCDSTVHLYLTVAKTQTITKAGCDTVVHNGQAYMASTTISDTASSLVTGCDSLINAIIITVYGKPVIQTKPSISLCKGNSIWLYATANGMISWDAVNNDSILVAPTSTTTYTALVVDANGCRNTTSATVNVQDFNLQLFASPMAPLANQTVLLHTTASSPYRIASWLPAALFPQQTRNSQSVALDSSQTITAIALSDKGCLDTATITIAVTPLDDIYIPTAFTPNSDGRNDEARVMASGVKEFDFKIFNRWGQVVFASNNISRGWDGRLAGKAQASDTYVFVVRIKTTAGVLKEKRGTITLLR